MSRRNPTKEEVERWEGLVLDFEEAQLHHRRVAREIRVSHKLPMGVDIAEDGTCQYKDHIYTDRIKGQELKQLCAASEAVESQRLAVDEELHRLRRLCGNIPVYAQLVLHGAEFQWGVPGPRGATPLIEPEGVIDATTGKGRSPRRRVSQRKRK